MLKITKVKRNSLAKALGLEVGDVIRSLNGLPCEDELDLIYYAEMEQFDLCVLDRRTGEERALVVEKTAGEPLGVE